MPAVAVTKCGACNGRGYTFVPQLIWGEVEMVKEWCEVCEGEGELKTLSCETCRGTGTVPAHYEWRGIVGDGEAECPDCAGTGRKHGR